MVLVSVGLVFLVLLVVSGCVALYTFFRSPRYYTGEATLQVTQPVCGTWQAFSGSMFGPKIPRLNDFAAVAPDDVWGVGGGTSYHWNGAGWKEVQLPRPSTSGSVYISSIAVLPTGEAWAVGSRRSADEQSVAYHWDGNSWALTTTPDVPGATTELRAVAAISRDDVWAVGSYTIGDQRYSLSLHWDGTSWKRVDGLHDCPGDQYLGGLAAFASDDVWAVGGCSNGTLGRHMTETYQGLVQRWDGRAWRVMPAPVGTRTQGAQTVPQTGGLGAITATGPNDIWVEGSHMASNSIGYWSEPLLFHWDGVDWSPVDLTQSGVGSIENLSDLVAVAPDDVWAVGYYHAGANLLLRPIALHWDGREWERVPVANPLAEGYYTDISVAGPHTLWATGFGFDHEDGEYYGLFTRFDRRPCPRDPNNLPSTVAP